MPTSENKECWYAIRTFFSQELKVGQYLEACGLRYFIPMRNRVRQTAEGRNVRSQHPVVHNLLFVCKTLSRTEMGEVLLRCPYPVSVYHHVCSNQCWCEITEQEIMDLRLICDMSFTTPKFITQEESDVEVGTEVVVTHGPMKGIQGKLVRKQKKYYLIKSLSCMGVMVAVSRWCCEALGKEKRNSKQE